MNGWKCWGWVNYGTISDMSAQGCEWLRKGGKNKNKLINHHSSCLECIKPYVQQPSDTYTFPDVLVESGWNLWRTTPGKRLFTASCKPHNIRLLRLPWQSLRPFPPFDHYVMGLV
jgi:hypothetical protein